MKAIMCKDLLITEREGEEVFSEVRKIKKIWKKVEDNTGRVWLYPVNVPNPGDSIHMWNPKGEHSGQFAGYGGGTLTFELEDGTLFKCKGPWHSNGEALKTATGIDLTDKHLTYVVISHGRKGEEKFPYRNVMTDIIYMDLEPTVGSFERGRDMAQVLANELDKEIYVYSKSSGGSSNGPVYPEREEDNEQKSN